MPHDAIRQAEQVTASNRGSSSASRDVLSPFVTLGVLGESDSYSIPSSVLTAIARHLGGVVVHDLPPFLIPCTDGMAIVLTIAKGSEYVGGAVFLPKDTLQHLDRGLFEVWQRAKKEEDIRTFFAGTAFDITSMNMTLPEPVTSSWRCAFC